MRTRVSWFVSASVVLNRRGSLLALENYVFTNEAQGRWGFQDCGAQEQSEPENRLCLEDSAF